MPTEKCPDCHGNGEKCLAGCSAHPLNWYKCETCNGSGRIEAGWHPISEAPQDGTVIWAVDTTALRPRAVLVRWEQKRFSKVSAWHVQEPGHSQLPSPTYFQYLEAPTDLPKVVPHGR